jgi:hypothetical protein
MVRSYRNSRHAVKLIIEADTQDTLNDTEADGEKHSIARQHFRIQHARAVRKLLEVCQAVRTFSPQLNKRRGNAKVRVEARMEYAAVAADTALIIFPIGILVGYVWRDRISRVRRAKYRVERWERERWAAHERGATTSAHTSKGEIGLKEFE